MNLKILLMTVLLFVVVVCGSSSAQVVLHGRVLTDRFPGSKSAHALSPIRVFASLPGNQAEALAFRTWETQPAGWYRLSGPSGTYSVVFSSPAHYMRPVVLRNLYTRNGDDIALPIRPRFDFANFHDGEWDSRPAKGYFQLFTARGTSITQVGFKLATDGVDGPGPGAQDILLSIHESGTGEPDSWKQVGPKAEAVDVDCGGPKGYWFSAGWNSGEVPTQPGRVYAVSLRPEDPGRNIQAFWRQTPKKPPRCFRVGTDGNHFLNRELWLAVGSDGDGLVIPYNKRVHKKYSRLTRFARRWSQTYVSQGRSLAAVILYAAVSGVQPPLSRQRVRVRVIEGGPKGRRVGVEKIAVGNGNYTGNASWGTFGVAYAPGEVPLVPGKTYALDFESIESYRTLHGFVNIKGQLSDDRPGFNPYQKCAPDIYDRGTAFYGGEEEMDFDLDLQVIEYAHALKESRDTVDSKNLLGKGDGESPKNSSWRFFALESGTTHRYLIGPPDGKNSILRISARDPKRHKVDGGVWQRTVGLRTYETYIFSGRIRSTWPLCVERQCLVGYDPTGQVDDPKASTIAWIRLPGRHGEFIPFETEPIRPQENTVSVWLRARSTSIPPFPFEVDFDNLALRRVKTEPPSLK